MAMFVHLTTESRIPRIRRNGISRLRKAVGLSPEGVFAVPVTSNFYASHQWLRELKRRNQGPIAGVYFRARTKNKFGSAIMGGVIVLFQLRKQSLNSRRLMILRVGK